MGAKSNDTSRIADSLVVRWWSAPTAPTEYHISSMFRPRFTESRQKLLTVSLVVSLQRAPGAVELPYCRRFKENLCRTGFQIKGLSRIYSKYLNNKLDHFLKLAGYIENMVSDLYNPPIM